MNNNQRVTMMAHDRGYRAGVTGLAAVLAMLMTVRTHAEYTETMKPDGLTRNAKDDDLIGRRIQCKDGHCALLFSPHSTHCGVVTVDDVRAVGCEFAVKLTGGFISKKKQHEGTEAGSFATGATIMNVHAVFGANAQLSAKHLPHLPKALRPQVVPHEDLKMLRGPSITAVLDHTNYDVKLENVTAEGFKYVKPILTREDAADDEAIRAMVKQYRRTNWRNADMQEEQSGE